MTHLQPPSADSHRRARMFHAVYAVVLAAGLVALSLVVRLPLVVGVPGSIVVALIAFFSVGRRGPRTPDGASLKRAGLTDDPVQAMDHTAHQGDARRS